MINKGNELMANPSLKAQIEAAKSALASDLASDTCLALVEQGSSNKRVESGEDAPRNRLGPAPRAAGRGVGVSG